MSSSTIRLIASGLKVLSPIADERTRSAETLVAADNPGAVVAKLRKQNIIVTEKPEGIRVSTDFFNNDDDVEKLIEGLKVAR